MPRCPECKKSFPESEVTEIRGEKSPFCPACIEKTKRKINDYPKEGVPKRTAKRATAKDNKEEE